MLTRNESSFLSRNKKIRDGFFFRSTKYTGRMKKMNIILCDSCRKDFSYFRRLSKTTANLRHLDVIHTSTRIFLTSSSLHLKWMEQSTKDRVNKYN